MEASTGCLPASAPIIIFPADLNLGGFKFLECLRDESDGDADSVKVYDSVSDVTFDFLWWWCF